MQWDKIIVGVAILLLSSPSHGKSLRLVDFEGEHPDSGGTSLFPGEFEGAIPLEDSFGESEVIDISSKLKGRPPMTRHNTSMVNTDPNAESVSIHAIRDDTATTGENAEQAKRTLHSYLHPEEKNSSSFLAYDTNSAMVSPVQTLSFGG
jgi:hypothetical protein